MPRKDKYSVYTDGGCSPNPGGSGGFGIVFVNEENGETWEYFEGYDVFPYREYVIFITHHAQWWDLYTGKTPAARHYRCIKICSF